MNPHPALPRAPSLLARAQAAVTPDIQAAFARDGAVCLRQLLTPEEMALLTQGVNANLAQPSPRAIVASQPGDPGFFIEDFCNWQSNAEYRRFIVESPLAHVTALLTGSQRVRLYHDHMLTKEPGTRTPTPWHQDQPYYNVSGFQNTSFWVPVDPVSRASTLEFLAGSHRGPWLMPRSFMTHQAKWFPEGSLAELPDINHNRSAHHILGWALAPGDLLCFHMLTLHAAAGVEGPQRRRVFSVRFLGDDMRHAPRSWKTSPDFSGLADELPAGAEMDHPLFPLLVDGTARAAA